MSRKLSWELFLSSRTSKQLLSLSNCRTSITLLLFNCNLSRIKVGSFGFHFLCSLFYKWANSSIFIVYFCLFITVQYRKLIACRIRTQIIRVEGEDANHHTTTTAKLFSFSITSVLKNNCSLTSSQHCRTASHHPKRY